MQKKNGKVRISTGVPAILCKMLIDKTNRYIAGCADADPGLAEIDGFVGIYDLGRTAAEQREEEVFRGQSRLKERGPGNISKKRKFSVFNDQRENIPSKMLSNPDLVSSWDPNDKTIPHNIFFQNRIENSQEQRDDTTLQGHESDDDSDEEKI